MRTIEQIFASNRVVPMATIENPENALRVGEALLKGGSTSMTVRILSQNSLKSLERIIQNLPELTVGASGIMDAAGFLNSSIAGAQFISSPGVTNELLTAARSRFNDAHFIPGVFAPSHIMEVLSRGFNVMNLFPVEAFNSDELLTVFGYMFPTVKFSISGIIHYQNLDKYLLKPNVLSVSIATIASDDLINKCDFAEITHRATAINAEVQKFLQNKDLVK